VIASFVRVTYTAHKAHPASLHLESCIEDVFGCFQISSVHQNATIVPNTAASTAAARRAKKREQDRHCQRRARERTKSRIAELGEIVANLKEQNKL
jgi:hypothetical protein